VNALKTIIITGLSGSGKSTALAACEDSGFYCVDNMPVALLPKFLELPLESAPELTGLVFVMDIRERGFSSRYRGVLDSLREAGYRFEIIFLEADENTLVRRYSQTRRQHPLAPHGDLIEAIREERLRLGELRAAADVVMDTSAYNVHELRSAIQRRIQGERSGRTLGIRVRSFGFKYGLPKDADLVIDVRFLNNPYFVPELKMLDGENQNIADFVLNNETCRVFLDKYLDLLDYLVPLYEREGKAYLTIAVGCTGGRHRSVAVAHRVFKHLEKAGRRVDLSHREIGQ
jgi:UPF0042 nucleotide-binding protein